MWRGIIPLNHWAENTPDIKSKVDLLKYHQPARVARESLELVNGPSHVDPPLLQAAHLVPPVIGKIVNV